MSLRTGPTVLFRVADRKTSTADCENLACDLAGVVTETSVVTGIILVGLAVLIALTYVQSARETCRHEQERVLDERDAFEEFANRVKSLDPVSAESSVAFAGGPSTRNHHEMGTKNTVDPTLRQLFSIYRGTVMSVPHYEEEYDETVTESMEAELGPDATMALAANRTLSAPTQRALVARGRKATAARTTLADAIETELDALSSVTTELASIDRRRRKLVEHLAEVRFDKTGAGIEIWNQLDGLENEAETIASKRQKSLHDPPMRIDSVICGEGEIAFYDYLYGGDEGPRHPVLSQVINLIATIREDRDLVASQITNSV